MSSRPYVGIDVSKAHLDVALHPSGEGFRFANDEAGIGEIVSRLAPLAPARIVLEATGGWERAVVVALAEAKLPVVVVNPRQVRDYAKSIGKLAKTDGLDAAVLARFGQAADPELRPLPDALQQELSDRVARRGQLLQMRTQEKNRRGTASPEVREGIEEHIAWLDEKIKESDEDIDQLLKSSPIWKEKSDLLRSVPGVGPALSFTLLSDLPEIGTLSRKEIAALVGIAPFNRDSGALRGRRAIWGGRARVRAALFMSAFVARRCNPAVQSFYESLMARGKPYKVAMVACMRKLLLILNAMMKANEHWAFSPSS
jgi:transposase